MGKVETGDVAERISKTLAARDDVTLVFLFGSFALGEATAFSDIDLAVYFTGVADSRGIISLREDLSEMLGIGVDIVVLNTAAPVIKMQVLKKGILLVNKDRRLFNKFFVSTMMEYDDLKRTRRETEEAILRGRIYA